LIQTKKKSVGGPRSMSIRSSPAVVGKGKYGRKGENASLRIADRVLGRPAWEVDCRCLGGGYRVDVNKLRRPLYPYEA